jgi:hypothetical protein
VPQSYAQAARIGIAGVALRAGREVLLAARPRDERRIIVRIASKEEAEALKE